MQTHDKIKVYETTIPGVSVMVIVVLKLPDVKAKAENLNNHFVTVVSGGFKLHSGMI
jgi:hypothetical protein